MIAEELKQLPTGPRELRKFGLVVGGVFLLFAAFFWWRNNPYHVLCLVPGVALFAFGVVWPRSLKLAYLWWMALAFVLGFVVSNVLLTLFFYLVVTPIGLAARLAGNDFLSRKLDRGAKSYWIARDRSESRKAEDYERQF